MTGVATRDPSSGEDKMNIGCRGVPSERRKSGPGVEPRTCKGAYRAEITFTSTNVNMATLAKGVRLRALNMNPEAAWMD